MEGWGISVDLIAMVGLRAASGVEFTACWEEVITPWEHNGAFDVSGAAVDHHFYLVYPQFPDTHFVFDLF